MLNIKTIKVGPLQTNCYLICHQHQCLIVDPGDEFEKIRLMISDHKPLAILLTHHHFDHIGALEPLLQEYSIPLYDSTNLQDNEEIIIGPFKFQTLYTKGHDDSCITFYFQEDNMMFVGDFIFKESIGRTDLETGDEQKMKKSLVRLKRYKQDIILYPGHGEATTLNYEKQYNFFLQG